MTTRVHAACILPIDRPPIVDGWIDVTSDGIAAVGGEADSPAAGVGVAPPERVLHLGPAAVLPGLVNAHTHLELSHLHGRVPPAASMVTWVRGLLAARRADATSAAQLATTIARAIAGAVATGTVAFGDIGNTDAAIAPLRDAPVQAWHFDERLGFRTGAGATTAAAAWQAASARDAASSTEGVRAGVAPHAPYSTAPDLVRGIVAGLDERADRRASMHVAESPEEGQLLADGTGPWRMLLEELGAWEPRWTPPGTTPVRYLYDLGMLHPRLLIVHGTQSTSADLELLARAGSTVVVCARSNAWVGAGTPPVDAMLAAGVGLAVGTDSLASVDDLDMFAELAALRRLAPDVPAALLLRAATLGGATALGFERLGALAPGFSPRALVVDLPADVNGAAAVTEWLVSGQAVAARRRWLDEWVASEAAA